MMSFFDSVGSFFSFLISSITNMINGLISLFQLLFDVFLIPPLIQRAIPSILFTSMMVFISISVIKLIVGR